MKKKIHIRFLLAAQLMSLLFCSSCGLNGFFDVLADAYDPVGGGPSWKIIPPGLTTQVSGQFREISRNAPIADFTVYVGEYINDPVTGLTLSSYIDSTRTDQNGNYQIPFVTTGKGVQYQLVVKWPDANWWVSYGYPWVIEHIGEDNRIDVSLADLSILEARVNIIENLHPPLNVSSDYHSRHSVYGANKDTTLFLRIMPNRKNRIRFNIFVDTLSTYYYREQIDTVNMEGDFSDTVRATFELYPTQFKKRD